MAYLKAQTKLIGNWEYKSWSTNSHVKIMKKNQLELQTFQQLCSMASVYLSKMCVHFLELPFSKCNENAVFSFKNTYNKEKGLSLFENDNFCYVS